MATDARVGTDLAGYRIESVLGRGGMSTVYLAEHAGLKRKVALKIINPELAEDARFRDRFVRESQLAASLDHPNIVPIYEAGEADGVLYIAMRYVKGTDLRDLIERNGPLDLARTARIVSQVASALDAAHHEGLVHRDVKPGNVLVVPPAESRAGEHVYLSDFGLTKRAASDSGITKTGQFMGTVDYVAPEQIEGKKVDGRTDQYSLACVAYECLAGEPPYRRDTEVATIYAHLKDDPPSIRAVRPEVPPEADAALRRGMAKRPEDRFPTCADLAEALPMAAPTLREIPGRGPSRRTLAAALAALVLVGILVGAIVLARDDPIQPTGPSSTSSQGPQFTEGVLVIDPESNRVSQLASGAFGSGAFFAASGGAVLAAGEGAAWTTSPGSHEVVRLDPETGEGTAISLPGVGCVSQLVVGEGAVWAVCPRFPDKVYRISPGSLDVVATIPVSQGLDPESIGGVAGAAVGDGAVWVLHTQGLVRVDVANDRGGRPFIITGDAVTVGHRQVWISDALAGTITALDSRTLETIGLIEVTGSVDDLVAGEGGVWVLNGSAGTVTRIDPVTYETSDPIGGVGVGATDIDAGAGSVWVANPEEGTITLIDPLTRRATSIDTGAPVVTVAVDQHGERVYVLVRTQ